MDGRLESEGQRLISFGWTEMSSKRTFELKLRDGKNQPYGVLAKNLPGRRGRKRQSPVVGFEVGMRPRNRTEEGE